MLVLLPGVVAAMARDALAVTDPASGASCRRGWSALRDQRLRFRLRRINLAGDVAPMAAVRLRLENGRTHRDRRCSFSAHLLAGSASRPTPSVGADVTAALLAALACTSLVVASGMKASLRNRHRAELAGTRDTPAPPGVMAMHSIRLAVVTTSVSLLFCAVAISGIWWLPLVCPYLSSPSQG